MSSPGVERLPMVVEVGERVGVGESNGENTRPPPMPKRAPLSAAELGSAALTEVASCATCVCKRARAASLAATRAARALHPESSLPIKGGADAALVADTAETADAAGDVAKDAPEPTGVGVDTPGRPGMASLLLAIMVAEQEGAVGDREVGGLVEVLTRKVRGSMRLVVASDLRGPCRACGWERCRGGLGARFECRYACGNVKADEEKRGYGMENGGEDYKEKPPEGGGVGVGVLASHS